jgi:hypothetical protein
LEIRFKQVRQNPEAQEERKRQTVKRASLLVAAMLSLTGCTRAPSVDILGSFFPAWLLCFTIAVIVTVFLSLLLSRLRRIVAYPVLFYPSLVALLTFAMWLVFFH